MQEGTTGPYILGLDLGVASIGWAILATDAKGRPVGIRRAGSHLFEAGVDGGKLDPETAMTRGKEQSKAKPRRDARSMRRQIWRRARRKKKVLGALMRHGLLPEGDIRTPAAIDAYIKALDTKLRSVWEPDGTSHIDRQKLPYRLRAAAAVRQVEKEELGRALYHLAQRRGFLSNRKAPERDDERSAMKADIADLEKLVAAHEVPTLGAYLASLDPTEKRLRCRWTSRRLYREEFDHIWKQQNHGFGEDVREEIEDAIFNQRPLKDQSHLIGRCSLIEGAPRCPIGLRIAQRFRILQQVNHLRIIADDFSERGLTDEERARLVDALCRRGDLSMAKARTVVGLPKGVIFSIERGGEKKLVGHRTDARLRAIFGERFELMDEAQRDAIVEDMRAVRLSETLFKIARDRWGLDADAAAELCDCSLEEGHSAHSFRALCRLVPHLERGASYSEARQAEFPEAFRSNEPHESLPPITDWEKDLRNPSVMRALTELRKLVNAVIRRHGKPERIHIELARDLKSGRSRREDVNRRMRAREDERARAASLITEQLGFRDPRGWQIEKWLLAEECNWICPFTGREFGARELLGSHAQFDVEHIWPFSKSLDNSFLNKTICYHEENRHRKRGHTPHQAYSGTPEQYEAILERIRRFKGDRFAVREKLRRFQEEIDADFTLRHLAETRYINNVACDYLGLLYGGRVQNMGQPGSIKRIITPSGGLTAWLRRGWGLDSVLSERDEKEREDHRHHAVDAIVIALASDAAIKRLSDAAQRTERERRERDFDRIEQPWESFIDDARAAIEAITVSHRQTRRVRGKLHNDTYYSKDHGGRRRVSKELWKLSRNDIDKGTICDARAIAAIRSKLAELGQSDPARAFQDRANLPLVRGHGGRMVPLRRVRTLAKASPRAFGSGANPRYATPDANHHMVFLDSVAPDGEIRRTAAVVTLAEAYQLKGTSAALSRQSRDSSFAFSLAKGEYVVLSDETGERVCRVTAISVDQSGTPDLRLVLHSDGRSKVERDQTISVEGLRLKKGQIAQARFRKVHVNYLGEVRNAGG